MLEETLLLPSNETNTISRRKKTFAFPVKFVGWRSRGKNDGLYISRDRDAPRRRKHRPGSVCTVLHYVIKKWGPNDARGNKLSLKFWAGLAQHRGRLIFPWPLRNLILGPRHYFALAKGLCLGRSERTEFYSFVLELDRCELRAGESIGRIKRSGKYSGCVKKPGWILWIMLDPFSFQFLLYSFGSVEIIFNRF